jgi:membrane protein DedA with SNARE-associated domain
MDPSWLLYLGIFIGPFVQEDAAVIAAATLSAHDPQHFPVVFFVILFGLFVSDIWKYWIGYSAHASARARKWAEKDKVMSLQDKVERHAFGTLLTARFLPLARVPVYIACGYFKMSYVKFCVIIFVTALLYCTAIFSAIHLLGEAFGDEMEMVMGAVICGVIFLLVSAISLKGMLGRRASGKAKPAQLED